MERHAPSPTPIPDMINAIIDIFFTEIPLNFAQIGFPALEFLHSSYFSKREYQ